MRGRPILCGILLAHAVVVFTPPQPAMSAWAWTCAGLAALAAGCLPLRVAFSLAWRDRIETEAVRDIFGIKIAIFSFQIRCSVRKRITEIAS